MSEVEVEVATERSLREELGNRPVDGIPVSKYSINVDFLNRGAVLRVGCQAIAVESNERLISLISQYISNPEETQRKYYAGEL